MPKISLMIHTASLDNFLITQGIPSYFDAVTENLTHQVFSCFEFIYIDRYYENNKEAFKNIIQTLPYKVKHVPVHPNHRYWFDKGYCYISAAKNTGIIHADGELLVSCDDGQFFINTFLNSYWKHYKKGHLLQGLYKRLKNIKTNNGKVQFPIEGEEYINDSRFRGLDKIKYHKNGDLCFSGTSFPLQTALKLNGFNEKMDGYKSLDDSEFGVRLQLNKHQFVIDSEAYSFILDHPHYLDLNNLVAIENFGFISCARELKDVVVNKPCTKEQLEIINRETKKYRNFDIFSEENKQNFDIWLNVPNFNLAQEKTN